jgi:hypothetical protein
LKKRILVMTVAVAAGIITAKLVKSQRGFENDLKQAFGFGAY